MIGGSGQPSHYLPGTRPDDLPISATVWDAAKKHGKQSEAVAVALYEAVKQLEAAARMTDQAEPLELWLTRPEVAERLHLTVATLNDWASQHTGPPFKKFGGRVRYQLAEVEAWEDAQPGGGGS